MYCILAVHLLYLFITLILITMTDNTKMTPRKIFAQIGYIAGVIAITAIQAQNS